MSIMFSGRRSPFTPFAPSRLSDTCVAYPGRIGVISDAYIALGNSYGNFRYMPGL